MINFILWLVVGAIIGWAASSLMGTRNRLLLNIVVGIVGAFLAGLFLTPYLGISTINQNNFSLPALLVSLLGALILLTVLSFFSRRTQETTEDFDEEVTLPEVTQPIAETQAGWPQETTEDFDEEVIPSEVTPPIVETQAAAVGNFCRQCGTANPTDAQFCKSCGANLGLRQDLVTA
jgi:uncharacterized membrane protein YeaQ/YmgE (transglycosylase-associated protein family)/ribosomal protein L40E